VSVGELRLDDLKVGDELPVLNVETDALQLFFFSAATQNGHRIHYDQNWATQVEGYPGLLVQGTLQEALLFRTITDWAGGSARILRFAVQNRRSAFAGDRLAFGGRVTNLRVEGLRGIVELDVHAMNGAGDLLMPGQATVIVPCALEE
jgi:hydroxyacyl-ACP dehydratase HTD2-like protein with hotdog domain